MDLILANENLVGLLLYSSILSKILESSRDSSLKLENMV